MASGSLAHRLRRSPIVAEAVPDNTRGRLSKRVECPRAGLPVPQRFCYPWSTD